MMKWGIAKTAAGGAKLSEMLSSYVVTDKALYIDIDEEHTMKFIDSLNERPLLCTWVKSQG